jgi:hypothetical protein
MPKRTHHRGPPLAAGQLLAIVHGISQRLAAGQLLTGRAVKGAVSQLFLSLFLAHAPVLA